MEFKEFRNLLFEKAIEAGFDECEVYFKEGESLSISVYEEEVEKYNLDKSFGLSFRGKINKKMGYSFTEILDEESIDMLVKNAKDAALVIENDSNEFIYKGDEEYNKVNTYSSELENIDASKLIKLALEMEKETKNYSDKVVNISGCKISYSSYSYGISNTKGLELNNKDNLLLAYVAPVVEDNNEKYDGMGYATVSSPDEINPTEIAKQGVKDAESKIGGKSIPSRKYKTIIYNEAMVSLLDTFSGVFSGDTVQKGLSLLKGKEGKLIASPIVTIVDDPLLDNGLASTPFDDEGVATFKKEVVSKGVLTTLLHNLKTADKAGIKTTGNGFKDFYSSTVNVSPTNFYIERGNKSIDELIESIGEGLIVTDFAGLHSGASAITGDFSLAAKGFYVENGKRSYPVEQITVAGNFFEVLKDIEIIGDDLKFPLNSVGSPSVVVKELSVAGK